MAENALAALAIPATILQAIDFLLPHALQIGAAQHQVLQQLHFGWSGTPSPGTLLLTIAKQHFGILFIGLSVDALALAKGDHASRIDDADLVALLIQEER